MGRKYKARDKDHSCHYPDKGCDKAKERSYYGVCLDCPFPKCLEDDKEIRRAEREARDKIICEFFEQGKKIKEIAESFGLTTETIRKIRKRGVK